MADFFQNGSITTLHDLRTGNAAQLEGVLERATTRRPLALILPVTASDMRAPAFAEIVNELVGVRFLTEIVVVLNVAPAVDDFLECRRRVAPLGDRAHVVWCDGPRVQEIYSELAVNGIYIGPPGKGRAVWTAYGYLMGEPAIDAYALHDCDITTYSRELLVRLCLPVVHPNFDFSFAKAYYARFSDQLHGRVTRLLVTPLVRALDQSIGPHPFLHYLDSFRYPLSGEFSITADVAAVNRVPGDWGLEIGTLAEVYRNVSIKRVCQVDICPRYDHKHQVAAAQDQGSALATMVTDIVTTMFRTLTAMGTTLHREHYLTVRSAYLRNAQDAIHHYAADAEMNGLLLDRHAEEMMSESFARLIESAADRVAEDPTGSGQIPNWARVQSALPGVPGELRSAARLDRLEHASATVN